MNKLGEFFRNPFFLSEDLMRKGYLIMKRKKPHRLGCGLNIVSGLLLILPEVVLHNKQVVLDAFSFQKNVLAYFIIL